MCINEFHRSVGYNMFKQARNLKPEPRQTCAKMLVDPLELIICIQKGDRVK